MPIYFDENKNKYIVKVYIHGRQILRKNYLGKTITTKNDAIACEKDLFIQYNERLRDYKINDLFNLYNEYLFKKYKETSASRYFNTFNHVIKKYFVNRKISEITPSYCEYLNDSINSLPYRSNKLNLFIVKSFILFLTNYGCKNLTNKFYEFRKNRIKINKYDFYTLEEFNKFIKVITKKEDELIFKLLFYYGLRIGELRGLNLEDCKIDRISINKTISNKGRYGGQIIIDPKTTSSFRDYPYVSNIKELILDIKKEKDLNSNDFIFINKVRNVVIGETTIRRKIEYYSSLAHIKKIKIHEFRHSCATFLINNDVDIKDIANWLGHSSPDITSTVYAHLLPLRKDKVKNIIDRL